MKYVLRLGLLYFTVPVVFVGDDVDEPGEAVSVPVIDPLFFLCSLIVISDSITSSSRSSSRVSTSIDSPPIAFAFFLDEPVDREGEFIRDPWAVLNEEDDLLELPDGLVFPAAANEPLPNDAVIPHSLSRTVCDEC